MAQNSKLNITILFIILFAAAVLRLYAIFNLPLNEAEAFALATASRPMADLMGIFFNHGDKYLSVPFLYVLFIKAFAFISTSEFVLRLPGVLFGILALVFAFLVAKKLAGGAVALLTTLLLAISPNLIMFSANLYHHSFLFFLVVFSTWLLLIALEAKSPLLLCIVYFFAYLLVVLLYPPAVILVIPFTVIFFVYAHPNLQNRIIFTALNCVLLGIATYWLLRVPPALAGKGQMFSSYSEVIDMKFVPTPFLFLFKFVEVYIGAFYTLSGLFYRDLSHPTGWHVIAFIPVLLLFHIAMFHGFKPYSGGEKSRTILFMSLAFSLTLGAVFALFGAKINEAFIPAMLFFTIIIATGIVRHGSSRFRIALAATLLCMFIASVPDAYRYGADRNDWRQITKFLQNNLGQDEAVVLLDGWQSPPYFHYAGADLASRTFPLFPEFALKIVDDHRLQEDIVRPFSPVFDFPPGEAISDIAAKNRRLWVVYAEKFPENNPRIEANGFWLDDNTTVVRKKVFPHITVDLVQPKQN